MNCTTVYATTRVQQRRLFMLSMKWNFTRIVRAISTHFISYRFRNVEAGCRSLQQSERGKQENLVRLAGVKRNPDGQLKKMANILTKTSLFLSKSRSGH